MGDVMVMGTLQQLFAQIHDIKYFPSNASLLWAYDFLAHMKAMIEKNTHTKCFL